MSDSKFKIDTHQSPDPKSTPSNDGQPSGMKSDSELHKYAEMEDNGKC